MTRRAVSSDRAPAALGPYSQAIVAGGFVFCSGMAGIDAATVTIPDGIEAQTEQALVSLSAVLAAAGASLADVVKTTIFYADVEDFSRLTRSTPGTCRTRRQPAPRHPTFDCLAVCLSRSRRSRCCRASDRRQPRRSVRCCGPGGDRSSSASATGSAGSLQLSRRSGGERGF